MFLILFRKVKKEINLTFEYYKLKVNKQVKNLLLLGPGSSGKSTLFKQIKCIHGNGFEYDELKECKHMIFIAQ